MMEILFGKIEQFILVRMEVLFCIIMKNKVSKVRGQLVENIEFKIKK